MDLSFCKVLKQWNQLPSAPPYSLETPHLLVPPLGARALPWDIQRNELTPAPNPKEKRADSQGPSG